MVNDFGKFCRKLRIDKGELLADMAKNLGVSPAFLSKVENGGKKPPKEWQERISSIYQLKSEQKKVLEESMFRALNHDSIDISEYSDDNRELILSFARKLNSMDDNKRKQFKKMVEK